MENWLFEPSASFYAMEASQVNFDTLDCFAGLVETVPAHLRVPRIATLFFSAKVAFFSLIFRRRLVKSRKMSGLREKGKFGRGKKCGH